MRLVAAKALKHLRVVSRRFSAIKQFSTFVIKAKDVDGNFRAAVSLPFYPFCCHFIRFVAIL